MLNIKKAFTPILIFTFLCQGIVFAAPDSSTLRPPMQFNQAVKTLNRDIEWESAENLEGILVNKNTGRIKFANDDKLPAFVNFTLWALRHGETEGNKLEGYFQGSGDNERDQLTDKGRKQAYKAAKSLFDSLKDKINWNEDIVVVTSELPRTKDTAKAFIDLVKERIGVVITPVSDELANEISFGAWGNKTANDLSPKQRVLVSRYRDEFNATVKAGGGESFLNLLERQDKLLNKLNNLYKGKTVIIFGHGRQISAIRVLLGDKKLVDEYGQINWRKDDFPNAYPLLISSITLRDGAETALSTTIKISQPHKAQEDRRYDKQYFITAIEDKGEIKAVLDKWFRKENRHFIKSYWDSLIKKYVPNQNGFLIKLESSKGEILGLAFVHKEKNAGFIFSSIPGKERETAPIYTLDLIEASPRNRSFGALILAKALEISMQDRDIKDYVLYAAQTERANNFYVKNGADAVITPIMPEDEDTLDKPDPPFEYKIFTRVSAEALLERAESFEFPTDNTLHRIIRQFRNAIFSSI